MKLSLHGAGGRLGQEISRLAKTDSRFELLAALDFRQKKAITTLPEVVIDVSSPEGAVAVASWCEKNKISLVTGVTGLTVEQEKKIKASAKSIPLFSSPNLSIGLNGMAQAVAQFAKIFPSGEVAIEDIHHRHKKDAPSGTAKFLHQTVKENINAKSVALEPVSIRAGEVFGIHKVTFFMEGESVSFEHQAENRSVFARGALDAAYWVVGQSPGLYAMKDLLQAKTK